MCDENKQYSREQIASVLMAVPVPEQIQKHIAAAVAAVGGDPDAATVAWKPDLEQYWIRYTFRFDGGRNSYSRYADPTPAAVARAVAAIVALAAAAAAK